MDYPVPNFGIDVHDVATTFNSLDVAESMLKHRWNYDPSQKPKPEEHTEYNFEPALDQDVIDSNAHAELAEKSIAEQAKAQEEAAKKGEEEKKAEEEKKPEEEKKTEEVKKEEEKKVEEKTALQVESMIYESHQLKELMRQHEVNKKEINYNNPIALAKLTSDPIFGTGEEPSEHKFGAGGRKIVAYPDPDEQGLDEDIRATQKNLQSSQKYWQHTWEYDTSKNMPNFAIPGKPEYDGENRTNLRTFGKWHIPFYTDERSSSTAQASAQVNQQKIAAAPAKVSQAPAPAPAKVQVAQAVKPAPVPAVTPAATPALAHKADAPHNASNSTQQASQQATQHAAQTLSRSQIRERLTTQISQLQKEIQDIWKLQQEKENTLHNLQQELLKSAEPEPKKEDNSGKQAKRGHHHRRTHHHARKAEAQKHNETNASRPALSQNEATSAVRHHNSHHH
jgi:hypothetical protein